MAVSQDIAAFIDFHVTYAMDEAANYANDGHHLSAVNALALALHKFVAGITRDVDAAEHAESEFRRRVHVLDDAASEAVH